MHRPCSLTILACGHCHSSSHSSHPNFGDLANLVRSPSNPQVLGPQLPVLGKPAFSPAINYSHCHWTWSHQPQILLQSSPSQASYSLTCNCISLLLLHALYSMALLISLLSKPWNDHRCLGLHGFLVFLLVFKSCFCSALMAPSMTDSSNITTSTLLLALEFWFVDPVPTWHQPSRVWLALTFNPPTSELLTPTPNLSVGAQCHPLNTLSISKTLASALTHFSFLTFIQLINCIDPNAKLYPN